MKGAYYFEHDSNARHDPKLQALVAEKGMEGYGRYFALLELLSRQADYRLALRDFNWHAIALQLHCDCTEAKSFVDALCVVFELLARDETCFWSPRMLRDMQRLEQKRERMRENAGKRWACKSNAIAKQKQSKSKAKAMQTTILYSSFILSVYEDYSKRIRAGAKQDALKWIKRRVDEHGEPAIARCVKNYASAVTREKTEPKYRLQANNFFGERARYADFIEDEPEESMIRGIPTWTGTKEPWEDG